MDNDLVFQIALTKVKSIGDFHAKTLISHYKTAREIFYAPKSHLEKIEGIGTIRANNIKKFNHYNDCEAEIKFIERHKITPLFYTKESYPNRLRNCIDSPILLYYKGVSDLNCKKIISIVGTRNNSLYGKEICEQIIDNLKPYDVTVVSGLAYGIDTIAHKAALKNKLSTISILAHGLDRIYPPSNRDIAKEIIECGGLLTEFSSGTNPDKQNFPSRNRITAGLCDALIVIESGAKGGSLITADIANSYNRDVFAIPGRINDSKSEGCNILIQQNKAALISSANDLIEYMQWEEAKKNCKKPQLELFSELSISEKAIMDVLKDFEEVHIDSLNWKLKMSFSELSASLLTLEMNGLVKSLPGKVFRKY
jgi:DNA processing protein